MFTPTAPITRWSLLASDFQRAPGRTACFNAVLAASGKENFQAVRASGGDRESRATG